MPSEMKVSAANQTRVPAEVRQRFGVLPGDIVVWEPTPDGELRVRFRRRRSLWDLTDIAPGAGGGDAVAAKHRAQRGES